MRIVSILALIAVIVGVSSCYYDNVEELYGTSPCDVTAVSWTADIQPMIQQNCVGCHSGAGASAGLDLSTYTAVKTHSSNLVNRMNKPNGDPLLMPPSGPLSNCTLNQMDAWVASGAPEN